MGCGLGAVVVPAGSSTDIDVPEHLYGIGRTETNRGDQGIGIVGWNEDGFRRSTRDGITDGIYHDAKAAEARDGAFEAGIVHTRYATSGTVREGNTQPFHVDGENTFIIAHNGNIPNVDELVAEYDLPYEDGVSDTAVIGEVIGKEPCIRDGIRSLEEHTHGAFTLLMMEDDGTVYGYRDVEGYRPLWYTHPGDGDREVYAAMSETIAARTIGIYDDLDVNHDGAGLRDLLPGQLLVMDDGVTVEQLLEPDASEGNRFCSFEPIYFQQPASQVRVNGEVRLNEELRYDIGLREGEEEELLAGSDALVFPVLASGQHYGEGFAEGAGLEEVYGMTRNRDGRMFLAPQERATTEQRSRLDKATVKHVPIPEKFEEGQPVVAVDDSIVRGNTSRAIVDNLRNAGAGEVHLRIMYPKIQNPCLFGIDHSDRSNLIAVDDQGEVRSDEKIAAEIGADSVRYVEQSRLRDVLGDNMCFQCTGPEAAYDWIPDEAEHQFDV